MKAFGQRKADRRLSYCRRTDDGNEFKNLETRFLILVASRQKIKRAATAALRRIWNLQIFSVLQ